jgi:hypothetical protein
MMAHSAVLFKVVWQVVAMLVLLNHGMARVTTGDGTTRAKWPHVLLPEPHERLNDFFQEWAAARNWHTGQPIYSHHAEAIKTHLGLTASHISFAYNAHPPTSVLLALPLGGCSLRHALAVWHLLSLLGFALSAWLVGREWGVRGACAWGWWVLPGAALALALKPVEEQFAQGQMNGILLPLLVGAWVTWRRGWLGWAGAFLGVAATLKIFPVFFVLLFILRRQPRGIVTGACVVAGLTLLTVGVLGFDAYRDYLTRALPSLSQYRPGRMNDSVVGFWHRLFVENTYDGVRAWIVAPVLAWVLTGLSAGGIIGVAAWHVYRAQTEAARDRAYWLLATAMVLLGPLTWPHSAMLLSVGVAYLGRDVRPTLPPQTGTAWLLLGLLASFLVRPAVVLQERGWLPEPVPRVGQRVRVRAAVRGQFGPFRAASLLCPPS